jgi:hypothetical protein
MLFFQNRHQFAIDKGIVYKSRMKVYRSQHLPEEAGFFPPSNPLGDQVRTGSGGRIDTRRDLARVRCQELYCPVQMPITTITLAEELLDGAVSTLWS